VRGRVSWRAVEWAVIIGSAAFSVAFIWRASAVLDGQRTFTLFDDAAISMRYGRNLVDGHGLVFNPGQHVEGYTNLLWTLIMAVVQVLVPARRFASGAVSLLGAALLVAQLLVVRAFTRRLTDVEWAPSVAVGGTAFSFALAFWTLRGMEVGLLACLLTTAAFLIARTIQSGVRLGTVALTAALLGLALFTRDDAAVPCGVMIVFLVCGVDRVHRRLAIAAAIGGASTLIATRLLLRWVLYGHLVPNTYVLKIEGIPKHLLVERGLLGLGYVFGFGLAIPVGVALVAYRGTDLRATRLVVLMLGTIVVAQLVYSVVVGGDAWEDAGFANRFLATVAGPLSILAAVGLANLARGRVRRRTGMIAMAPIALAAVFVVAAPRFTRYFQLGDQNAPSGTRDAIRLLFLFVAAGALAAALWWRSARPAVVVVIALVAVVAPNALPFTAWARHNQPFQASDSAWARYGERLNAATQPGAAIAASSIGNIGYFSQRRIVDELGKVDETIARRPAHTAFWMLPGHWRWDYRYSIVTLRPDVVAELFGPTRADEQMIQAAGYERVPSRSGPVYVRADTTLVNREQLRNAALVAR
jgi:hypothetical protein